MDKILEIFLNDNDYEALCETAAQNNLSPTNWVKVLIHQHLISQNISANSSYCKNPQIAEDSKNEVEEIMQEIEEGRQ